MPLVDDPSGATIYGDQIPGDPDLQAPRTQGPQPDPIQAGRSRHVSLLDGLFTGGGSNLTPPRDPEDDGQVAFGQSGDLDYTEGGSVGDVLSKDASGLPVWSPRAGLTINSFTQSTVANGIARIGHTYASIAFAASYNVSPTTATNSDGTHTDDVHATPTAFNAVHSYAFTGPSSSFTWTLNAGIPGSTATPRTVTVMAGNDSLHAFAARTASMDQTAFNTFAAAATKELDTNIGHSYAFGTDDGTHAATMAWPSRYGAPATIKDHATGFGQSWTQVGSGLTFTNSDGYPETYNVWQLDVSSTSAFTTDVT